MGSHTSLLACSWVLISLTSWRHILPSLTVDINKNESWTPSVEGKERRQGKENEKREGRGKAERVGKGEEEKGGGVGREERYGKDREENEDKGR